MVTANSLGRSRWYKYCSSYTVATNHLFLVTAPNCLFLRYRPPTAHFCVTAPRYKSNAPRGAVPPTLGNNDLNIKKIVCMVTSKNAEGPVCCLESKGENIKQVSTFKYLGYRSSAQGKCLQEVKTRIALAKDAFNKLKPIMKDRNISLKTKMRILKTYVWSAMLYGCESWTVNIEITNRIAAAEMWFLRRMLRVSWADRVTNEEVLGRAGTHRELLNQVRRRQIALPGHVYRKDDVERQVLTGRVQGKRDRGRQRMTFLQSLRNWATLRTTSRTDFLRAAERREGWRRMTADACSRQGT